MSKCTLQLAAWDAKDTLSERGVNVIPWSKKIKAAFRQHCLKRTAEGMDSFPATRTTVPVPAADSWVPVVDPNAPLIHHDATFLEKRKAKAYDKYDQEVEDRAAQDEVQFQFLLKAMSEGAKSNLELRNPVEYTAIVEAPNKDKWLELWNLVQDNFYVNPRGTTVKAELQTKKQLLTKLLSIKQGKESTAEFFEHIRDLIQLCGVASVDYDESMIADSLIEAMHDSAARVQRDHNEMGGIAAPQTIKQAMIFINLAETRRFNAEEEKRMRLPGNRRDNALIAEGRDPPSLPSSPLRLADDQETALAADLRAASAAGRKKGKYSEKEKKIFNALGKEAQQRIRLATAELSLARAAAGLSPSEAPGKEGREKAQGKDPGRTSRREEEKPKQRVDTRQCFRCGEVGHVHWMLDKCSKRGDDLPHKPRDRAMLTEVEDFDWSEEGYYDADRALMVSCPAEDQERAEDSQTAQPPLTPPMHPRQASSLNSSAKTFVPLLKVRLASEGGHREEDTEERSTDREDRPTAGRSTVRNVSEGYVWIRTSFEPRLAGNQSDNESENEQTITTDPDMPELLSDSSDEETTDDEGPYPSTASFPRPRDDGSDDEPESLPTNADITAEEEEWGRESWGGDTYMFAMMMVTEESDRGDTLSVEEQRSVHRMKGRLHGVFAATRLPSNNEIALQTDLCDPETARRERKNPMHVQMGDALVHVNGPFNVTDLAEARLVWGQG